MATLGPLVLEGVNLIAFIQYILHNHAGPSTVAVCCTREAFLEQLSAATSTLPNANPQHEDEGTIEDTTNAEGDSNQTRKNPWATPTLRLLATSRTVKLAFCPDVTHLRACLATYAPNIPKRREQGDAAGRPSNTVSLLAVLNPIQLHRPTSAFSAQGLSRTFAVAVEAAYRAGSRLILAECREDLTLTRLDDPSPAGEEPTPEASTTANSWDDEVSILNVTTKTFGAGERGWVGRTVKIRAIAGRWCTFERLDEYQR